MQDWIKLIEEDEAQRARNNDNNDNDSNYNNHNDTYDEYEGEFELPSPTTIENDDGTLTEITYQFNDDATKIIRIEKLFQIITTTQKISKDAINRRRNWVKFGKVKSIPKGQIEHNITLERQTGYPDGINIFIWTDKDGNKQKPKKQQSQHRQNNQRVQPQKNNDSKDDIKSNDDNVSTQSSNRYIPPWKRSNGFGSEYGDEVSVDIRISNLPQWTERDNVKQLINAFYQQYIGKYPPRGYKIKMTPSQYTLQRWEAEGNTEMLENYDVGAFVEFKNEKYADMAVKILNGHRYEYCVLQVEKAKPKNSGSGKGNTYSKFHSRSR